MESTASIRNIINETTHLARVQREQSVVNRVNPSFRDALQETIVAANVNEARHGRLDSHERRLWNACVELESIFVARMLKEMRNTLNPQSRLLYGGQAEEIFTDMLYDQYAVIMSRTSNFGIANLLFRELSRMR
ncbi:MAG: rod-binding protein [Spirochaetes bacterium]|nr:rod-binding protein [Spirochaetota bacterium]